MRRNLQTSIAAFLVLASCAISAQGVTNIALNPGFEDLNNDGAYGDSWTRFGASGFNNFFGNGFMGRATGSLFGESFDSTGGYYQTGIPAVAGQRYQFDLVNTWIEPLWDADLRYGVQFYAADDATLLGENLALLNTAARLAIANGGAARGSAATQGVAPAGTAFVRPIVQFDFVNPTYFATSGTSAFVFESFLSAVPAPGGELLKNPSFDEEINGYVAGGEADGWVAYGAANFANYFGPDVHGSLYANYGGASGGLYQQAILAEPGATYAFSLDNVRIEENWDANLRFGLEYLAADDATMLGSTFAPISTLVKGDGLSFSMTAAPVAGTVYIRPVIQFDGANSTYFDKPQANAFVFDTSLVKVVSVPGDFSGDGRVDGADLSLLLANWGSAVPPVASGWVGSPPTSPAVNADELSALLSSWGFGTATAVPEPAAASLVGLTLCGFCARTRRRSAG
jgi:hypothetical protein